MPSPHRSTDGRYLTLNLLIFLDTNMNESNASIHLIALFDSTMHSIALL